jgi:Amt family ammonium transporter
VQALGVGAAFATVFTVSFLVFSAIKKVYGLRVRPEEERYGLDIVEHGMWGYPEAFMPVPGSEYRPPVMPQGWPPRQPAPVTQAQMATQVQEG